MATLEEISELIWDCPKRDACKPLFKQRDKVSGFDIMHYPTPGYFDEGAEVMFVGQNPGIPYELSRLPLSHRCGLSLEEFMESYRADFKSFPPYKYILSKVGLNKFVWTNIVKCPTRKNLCPSQYQVGLCKPYLLEQMRAAKPKLVVLVGLVAMKSFGVSVHGEVINGLDYKYIGFPHYAAVSQLELAAHVNRLKAVLKELGL